MFPVNVGKILLSELLKTKQCVWMKNIVIDQLGKRILDCTKKCNYLVLTASVTGT